MVRAHTRCSPAVTTLGDPRASAFPRRGCPPFVSSRAARSSVPRPPHDFDDTVDWFERFSYDLVLLSDYPLLEIRGAVRHFDRTVREHVEAPARPASGRRPTAPREELERIVAADHAWFLDSLGELGELLSVVERDDHGGNRQALGQYGRVLAEALRRHRRDEERLRGRGVAAARGRRSAELGQP